MSQMASLCYKKRCFLFGLEKKLILTYSII